MCVKLIQKKMTIMANRIEEALSCVASSGDEIVVGSVGGIFLFVKLRRFQ